MKPASKPVVEIQELQERFRKPTISVALLKEWDDRLDAMETLLDAAVLLGESCEVQLAAAQRLRRLMREICPLENQPIVVEAP